MGKTEFFFCSETVVAYVFKIGRCIKINKQLRLNERERSRSLFDLGCRSFRFENYISFI